MGGLSGGYPYIRLTWQEREFIKAVSGLYGKNYPSEFSLDPVSETHQTSV